MPIAARETPEAFIAPLPYTPPKSESQSDTNVGWIKLPNPLAAAIMDTENATYANLDSSSARAR